MQTRCALHDAHGRDSRVCRRLSPVTQTLADLVVLLHAQTQCVLETELTNKTLGALRLYENLGFVRHKRCVRFVAEYLSGSLHPQLL